MRKFARPPPMRSSMGGGGGLSAAFLEAEDVEEDEEEEDPYLTASERARQALSRPSLDARSEVLLSYCCLMHIMRGFLQLPHRDTSGQAV